MNDIRDIRKYGMRKCVSRELATRQRTETTGLLKQDIEHRVRAEGYVPLPDQFSCRFVSPEEMAADPMNYGDEDSIFARDRDYFLAFASINCVMGSDSP